MRRAWIARGLFVLGAASLLAGCFASHGRESEGTRVEAPDPTDSGGPTDAGGVRDATPSPHGEDEDVCELYCEAQERSGCTASGCYDACDGRRRQARRIGCDAEWKLVIRCVTERPCSDGECGDASGWPECLRRRGRR